ncbi:MAG: redoxin domain-containing protein [Dehalococcoidia bacterium]|nr:redoxin domain-containing protein [Dehalococcoidia bacterium]
MTTKRKNAQPWWRKRRVQRRLAILGALALIVGVFAWLVVRGEGGGSGSGEFLREPAPPFTLPTVAEGQVSLSDHVGRHNTLLYFSEGIGCAPCFDQIVDLEADWDRFAALNVEMVSVMIDPMEELKAEIANRGIRGIVAADEDKSVSWEYEAMEASMHPGVKPGHTFVLVNKAGQMIWRWDWIGHGKPMYVEVDDLYKDVSTWLQKAGT